MPNLLDWLGSAKPDIVCLQELKTAQREFPVQDIKSAGYQAVWKGEKTWNGVAILSNVGNPIATTTSLPGNPSDHQSRYVEAAIGGILIGCIYAPNGNPQPGPKFNYKLAWLERLAKHSGSLIKDSVPAILAGDYNVVPTPFDIYPSKSWANDALVQPEVGPLTSVYSIKAGLTLFARSTPMSRCTRSGITYEIVGSEMTDCG